MPGLCAEPQCSIIWDTTLHNQLSNPSTCIVGSDMVHIIEDGQAWSVDILLFGVELSRVEISAYGLRQCMSTCMIHVECFWASQCC